MRSWHDDFDEEERVTMMMQKNVHIASVCFAYISVIVFDVISQKYGDNQFLLNNLLSFKFEYILFIESLIILTFPDFHYCPLRK